MLKLLKKYKAFIALFVVILIVFLNIKLISNVGSKEASNLVIYLYNISTKYNPFIENGGIYISVDTI